MPKEVKNKEPEHINMTKIFNIKPGDLVQVSAHSRVDQCDGP